MTGNSRLAYSVVEAAQLASVSQQTVFRAIHTTDYRSFPPPLRAKRIGFGPTAKYLILAADLQVWLDLFPEG